MQVSVTKSSTSVSVSTPGLQGPAGADGVDGSNAIDTDKPGLTQLDDQMFVDRYAHTNTARRGRDPRNYRHRLDMSEGWAADSGGIYSSQIEYETRDVLTSAYVDGSTDFRAIRLSKASAGSRPDLAKMDLDLSAYGALDFKDAHVIVRFKMNQAAAQVCKCSVKLRLSRGGAQQGECFVVSFNQWETYDRWYQASFTFARTKTISAIAEEDFNDIDTLLSVVLDASESGSGDGNLFAQGAELIIDSIDIFEKPDRAHLLVRFDDNRTDHWKRAQICDNYNIPSHWGIIGGAIGSNNDQDDYLRMWQSSEAGVYFLNHRGAQDIHWNLLTMPENMLEVYDHIQGRLAYYPSMTGARWVISPGGKDNEDEGTYLDRGDVELLWHAGAGSPYFAGNDNSVALHSWPIPDKQVIDCPYFFVGSFGGGKTVAQMKDILDVAVEECGTVIMFTHSEATLAELDELMAYAAAYIEAGQLEAVSILDVLEDPPHTTGQIVTTSNQSQTITGVKTFQSKIQFRGTDNGGFVQLSLPTGVVSNQVITIPGESGELALVPNPSPGDHSLLQFADGSNVGDFVTLEGTITNYLIGTVEIDEVSLGDTSSPTTFRLRLKLSDGTYYAETWRARVTVFEGDGWTVHAGDGGDADGDAQLAAGSGGTALVHSAHASAFDSGNQDAVWDSQSDGQMLLELSSATTDEWTLRVGRAPWNGMPFDSSIEQTVQHAAP